MRRTYDLDGNNVQINSGHSYNRTHRTGSVQGYGSMNEIEGEILKDVARLIKSRTSLVFRLIIQNEVKKYD